MLNHDYSLRRASSCSGRNDLNQSVDRFHRFVVKSLGRMRDALIDFGPVFLGRVFVIIQL